MEILVANGQMNGHTKIAYSIDLSPRADFEVESAGDGCESIKLRAEGAGSFLSSQPRLQNNCRLGIIPVLKKTFSSSIKPGSVFLIN